MGKEGFEVVEFNPYEKPPAEEPQEVVPAEEPKPEEKPVEAEPPKAEPPKAEPPTAEPGDPVRDLIEPEIDYKAEYEKLTAEKEVGKNNPYKNPNYYKLEVIEQETPNEANLYQRLLFGSPGDKELWTIGFLKDHPEFADDPEAVERKFQRTYPQLFNSDLTPEDQEYKDAKIDLRADAAKVKRELLKRVDSIQVPDPVNKEKADKDATTQLAQSWKPGFQQLASDAKFSVDLNSDKDKTLNGTYEFEIPKEEMRTYLERSAVRVLGGKVTYDTKNYGQVKMDRDKDYISNNLGKILTSIAEQVANKRDEMWAAKTNNPEPIKSTSVPKAGTPGDPKEAKAKEFLEKF